MSTVHAYAIHQIGTRINGKKATIPASTKASPSVFVTTTDDLAKLVKLDAARLATKEEVAIAKVQESVIDTTVATVAAEPATASVGDERPATGAKGDPQGNKKAAAAAAAAAAASAAAAAAAAETPASGQTPASGETPAASTETPAAEDI